MTIQNILYLPNKTCNHALRHALHTHLYIWHAHDARHCAYAHICALCYMSVFADHTKHRNSLHLTTHTCRTCTQTDMPAKFRLLISVWRISKPVFIISSNLYVCNTCPYIHLLNEVWYWGEKKNMKAYSKVFRREFVKQKAQFLLLWVFRLV